MDDGTSSWWLDRDGVWTRHFPDDNGSKPIDMQEALIRTRRTTRGADG
jgi:polyphosphate kinase